MYFKSCFQLDCAWALSQKYVPLILGNSRTIFIQFKRCSYYEGPQGNVAWEMYFYNKLTYFRITVFHAGRWQRACQRDRQQAHSHLLPNKKASGLTVLIRQHMEGVQLGSCMQGMPKCLSHPKQHACKNMSRCQQPTKQADDRERAHTVVFEPLLKKNLGVNKMKFKKEKLITGIFLSSQLFNL